MATPTYYQMANFTLAASATTVTISSISQSYSDLVLVISGTQLTSSNSTLRIQINGAATGYTFERFRATGSNDSGSGNTGSTTLSLTDVSGSEPIYSLIHLIDYSSTVKNKSIIASSSQTATEINIVSGTNATTSAITSIVLFQTAIAFDIGTTFTLYGVN